mmetsp:Transcript_41822/g.94397  ORF Transcript_41822/g.94397 Transcript_41822/m.94397 type:complete len:125 (+) Transcript_41822:101-475(+)
MAFTSYARFARCRAANLSLWSRRANLVIDGHCRGLAAAPLMRLCCSERLPALAFPEQRIAASGLAGSMSDSSGEGIVEDEDLALLIDRLAEPGAMLLEETLGFSATWLSHPGIEQGLRIRKEEV